VGYVRDVILGEDKCLWEMARLLFLIKEILCYLLNDLPVSVLCRPVDLGGGSRQLPLILEDIEAELPGVGIDQADLFPFLEKDPVYGDIRFDGNGIIVNQEASSYGPLIVIARNTRRLKKEVVCAAGVAVRPILIPSKCVSTSRHLLSS